MLLLAAGLGTPDLELLESLQVQEPGLTLFCKQLLQIELTGEVASLPHPCKCAAHKGITAWWQGLGFSPFCA